MARAALANSERALEREACLSADDKKGCLCSGMLDAALMRAASTADRNSGNRLEVGISSRKGQGRCLEQP